MLVAKDKIVSFHYKLSDADGAGLEDSHQRDPVVYLHGRSGILPGLEQAIAGKQAGDQVAVTLTPDESYGPRRDDAIQRVPIKHLRGKPKLKPGLVVAINTDKGTREATVVKVGRFNVDVDSNHPLAGKTLKFEIDVVDVRDATDEELSHGHAHGPGGHHH